MHAELPTSERIRVQHKLSTGHCNSSFSILLIWSLETAAFTVKRFIWIPMWTGKQKANGNFINSHLLDRCLPLKGNSVIFGRRPLVYVSTKRRQNQRQLIFTSSCVASVKLLKTDTIADEWGNCVLCLRIFWSNAILFDAPVPMNWESLSFETTTNCKITFWTA